MNTKRKDDVSMKDENIITAQAKVEAAAKTVAEWRSSVEAIRAKIADAKARAAEMELQRREHALGAALNQPAATRALASLHADQGATEKLLADLEYAVAQALARLATAQVEHDGAVLALRREDARIIIEKRVDAALRFDEAAAALDKALADFNRLYREIPDLDDGLGGWSVSVHEMRIGENRVKAALPEGIKKLLGLGGTTAPLASGERMVWRSVLGA